MEGPPRSPRARLAAYPAGRDWLVEPDGSGSSRWPPGSRNPRDDGRGIARREAQEDEHEQDDDRHHREDGEDAPDDVGEHGARGAAVVGAAPRAPPRRSIRLPPGHVPEHHVGRGRRVVHPILAPALFKSNCPVGMYGRFSIERGVVLEQELLELRRAGRRVAQVVERLRGARQARPRTRRARRASRCSSAPRGPPAPRRSTWCGRCASPPGSCSARPYRPARRQRPVHDLEVHVHADLRRSAAVVSEPRDRSRCRSAPSRRSSPPCSPLPGGAPGLGEVLLLVRLGAHRVSSHCPQPRNAQQRPVLLIPGDGLEVVPLVDHVGQGLAGLRVVEGRDQVVRVDLHLLDVDLLDLDVRVLAEDGCWSMCGCWMKSTSPFWRAATAVDGSGMTIHSTRSTVARRAPA